jgi:hypothetical protein
MLVSTEERGKRNEEVVFFVVVMWCTFVLEVLFLSLVFHSIALLFLKKRESDEE